MGRPHRSSWGYFRMRMYRTSDAVFLAIMLLHCAAILASSFALAFIPQVEAYRKGRGTRLGHLVTALAAKNKGSGNKAISTANNMSIVLPDFVVLRR